MRWLGRWRRPAAQLLAALLLLVALAGCWDQVPFPERAAALVVTIAPTTSPTLFDWTFYFPNPTVTVSSLSDLSTSNETYSVRVKAPTLASATMNAQQQLARDLFLGQLEVIIWSTKISSGTVGAITNAYNTNGEVPRTAYMLAASGRLSRLVVISPQETIPVLYLTRLFDCHRCQPVYVGQFQWQVWDAFQSRGISAFMPYASDADRVAQLAVYPAQGPPTVWTTPATMGWAYLMNQVSNNTLSFQDPLGAVAVTRLRSSARLHIALSRGQLNVTGTVETSATLAQWPETQSLTEPFLRHVEQQASAIIATDITTAIDTANRDHEDPFGFGRQWLLTHPAELSTDNAQFWAHTPIRTHVRVITAITVSGIHS